MKLVKGDKLEVNFLDFGIKVIGDELHVPFKIWKICNQAGARNLLTFLCLLEDFPSSFIFHFPTISNSDYEKVKMNIFKMVENFEEYRLFNNYSKLAREKFAFGAWNPNELKDHATI